MNYSRISNFPKTRPSIFLGTILLTFVLLSPILFRKYSVPLMSNGKVAAFAKRPFILPQSDNEFSVYVGESKIFSLWGDIYEGPWFIHPFADGKRFLCICDDDTSVLVFIIDLNIPISNAGPTPLWPPNDDLRKYMATRVKEVVLETKGGVRLPTYSELQETRLYLEGLTPRQLEYASFPLIDLGLYRNYAPKEVLLREIDQNRQSQWP